MRRNWTPRDALIDVLMEHPYVWAPGATETPRIIETMADGMLQTMDNAGYAFVVTKEGIGFKVRSGAGSLNAGEVSTPLRWRHGLLH